MLKHINFKFNNAQRKKTRYYKEDAFDFFTLIKKWDLIVGDKLAKVTCPLKINFKTLIVLTKHSIYSNELNYVSEAIRKKIFAYFPTLIGKFDKIKYQTSNDHFRTREENVEDNIKIDLQEKNKRKFLHPLSPEYKRLREEAIQFYGPIEDNELKEVMIHLFIQSKL
jgi:hypothetical protein